MRERMIEDLQRGLMLIDDELEVVVARSIGDSNRHQIRRAPPEQSYVMPLLSRDINSVRQVWSIGSSMARSLRRYRRSGKAGVEMRRLSA